VDEERLYPTRIEFHLLLNRGHKRLVRFIYIAFSTFLMCVGGSAIVLLFSLYLFYE